MKIIYHCYGGSHSSVTAAAIHLGLLPADHLPSREMFWDLPLFDRQEADQHGHIYYMGMDEYGHGIFLAARRGKPRVLENVFFSLADIFALPRRDYMFVNVMHHVNLTMRFGGFLSRRLGFTCVGRPIVTKGTQAAYFHLVDLVREVKNAVKEERHENPVYQRQQLPSGDAGRCDSHRQADGGRATGPGGVMGVAVFEYKRRAR